MNTTTMSTLHIPDIDSLILSFLSGEITAEEKDILKSWIKQSDDNKQHFKQMYLSWKAGAVIGNEASEKAYEKFSRNIFDNRSRSNIGLFKQSWIKWAAAIVISLTSGALLSYIALNKAQQPMAQLAETQINVPLGSKSMVTLPDGTQVWLNAGSKLSYGADYGQTLRNVNLEGEGYFKVQKNHNCPFVVHSASISVKALGTEFNVKAYPEEKLVETILVEGSVVVNQANANQANNNDGVVLKPGQKISYATAASSDPQTALQTPNNQSDKNIGEVKKANPEVETSWKEEKWIVKSERLESLFVTLSRRYNVSIDVESSDLLKYKFSGTIHRETLEQVFEILSLTLPLSYTIEKGAVHVNLNKDLERKYKAAYSY